MGKNVEVTIKGKNDTKGAFTDVEKGLNSLGKQGRDLVNPMNLLKGAIAGLGIASLTQLLKSSIAAAMDAEAAWAQVTSSLDNLGIHSELVRGELDQLFTRIQTTTRFADDDAARAFSTLVTVTGDYEASVKNLSLVADVAAKKQIDMASAADLVGKVIAGTGTRALKEFGISTTDAAKGLEQLRQKVQGFAENDGKTFEGRMHQIANAVDNVEESIGRALLGGEGSAGGLGGLADGLNRLSTWIDDHSGGVKMLADFFGFVGQNIDRVVDGALRMMALLPGLQGLVLLLQQGRKDLTGALANDPALIRALGLIPGGRGGHEETAEEKKERERIAKVAELYAGTSRPYAAPQLTLQGTGPITARAEAAALPDVGPLSGGIAKLTQQVDDFTAGTLTNFFSAWREGIDDIVQGHASLGEAILKTGRKAIAGLLASEGQATLLKAAAAAAEGLFNPLKLVQAGKLFLAGSAELAFASQLGGGGGGGYRSGGSSYSAGFSSTANDVAGKGRGTVIVNGTKVLFDLNDPDSLNNFKEMIYQLYGTREVDFVFRDA